MALTITNPAIDPFKFFFTDPVFSPPDPKDFPLTIDFASDNHGVSGASYSVNLTSLTTNLANTDRHGHNLSQIHVANPLLSNLTATSGELTVDFTVPYLYYARLSVGETVNVEFNVKITDNIDHSFDNEQVWLVLTGAEDPPIARDDFLSITDRVASFTDGRVLANDDDPDIHDKIHIVGAHLSGPVKAAGGTIFPPEYVPMPAGIVGHTATAITFHANPYFQFLAAGEKATFDIQYTISDGHLTSSAFLHVTIRGTATAVFNGTAHSDQMLGENGANAMFGNGGNDAIFGRGGPDLLHGGPGNDILDGGPGRDVLFGDTGRDTFVFDRASDTDPTAATADEIVDLTHGQDKIDLSRIDAIAGGGDDAFTFIGKSPFGHVPGQLRYDHKGTAVIVYGDVNGDGVADFAIRVDNHHAIAAGDFVL